MRPFGLPEMPSKDFAERVNQLAESLANEGRALVALTVEFDAAPFVLRTIAGNIDVSTRWRCGCVQIAGNGWRSRCARHATRKRAL